MGSGTTHGELRLFICRNCGIEERKWRASRGSCLPSLVHVFDPVPVVPALLTDELVVTVARTLYACSTGRSWESLASTARGGWRVRAVEALKAAGFTEGVPDA